jgi:hypothetical protein
MEAGIGMVDPLNADGSKVEGGAKVQKLYVEDEESDDGMAEVEEEARVAMGAAENEAQPNEMVKKEGGEGAGVKTEGA